MARTLAITYGTYVIGLSGTDSNVRPTGKYKIDEDYASFTLTFDVLVLGSTEAAFKTSEASLITAYTKPEQDLTVALGGQTRHSFSHSSNTGFDAQPSIAKVGGAADTDRSAKYRLSVSLKLPADLSGKAGRLSSSVDVNTLPNGARVVTLSGTYTALSSNDARAQFAADIDTWAATIKSDLSVTDWENVGTPTATSDTNDKTITFSRVYREIKRNQGVGTTDVSGLVNPRLLIRRVEAAANDTNDLGAVEPLRQYSVNYVATVDWATSSDLDAFYTSTIRPHILNEVETLAGGSAYIISENSRFDLDNNRLFVDWEVLTDSGFALLSATRVVEDVRNHGEVRYVVWNGNPYARDVYQGPKTWIKRVRQSVYRVAGSGPPSLFVPAPQGFRENNDIRKADSRRIGNQGGSQLDTEIVVASQEFERVDPPDAGGGGDGGFSFGISAIGGSTI